MFNGSRIAGTILKNKGKMQDSIFQIQNKVRAMETAQASTNTDTQTDRQAQRWGKREDPGTNPHSWGQWDFNTTGKATHLGRNSLFNRRN